MTKTRSTSMIPFSRLLACSILLLAPPLLAQIPETVNPGTVMPDDSVELENQIRRAKFDQVLPRVMRENGIDMWIHIVRPWTPDPLSFELGGNEGIFIFTDRGGDRIERAVFAGGVDDEDAYDIIDRPIEELPTFVDGVITEQPGGFETDYLEVRFDGVREFVAERDPRRIGVNYSDALGLAAASQDRPLTDGLSHTDYTLLMSTLGETYAERVVSAEHLILDYLAGRVAEEIELYHQFGLISAANLDREFGKVVSGVTQLREVEGNVFRRDPDGVEYHAMDEDPYVLQPGDVFTILHGAGNQIFYASLGGNAYLLREGEGKHIYIAFHDGAVVTEDGVAFPYPPDQGIRLIGPPAKERP